MSILATLREALPSDAPSASVALVFAGPTLDIPHGLVVGVHAATI